MAVRSLTSTALVALAPLLASAITLNSSLASSKRGLVYVDPTEASDLDYWDSSTSDLTWYYNYESSPTDAFTSDTNLSFVPMLWGAPSDPTTDTTFYTTVEGLLSAGSNISYVLGFNEPDGTTSTGGSDVTPEIAAEVWIKQFEPLRAKYGVKLGAPACTGANTGFTWLQEWMTACGALHSNGTGCIVDFIPIHWYGNFEGLASHIGQVNGTYENVSAIWVTEYAYADQDLEDTQTFYNESSSYFDRLDYITHYSYFGAFRSSVSNVGAYAAMLNQDGDLTDIGAWYLGYDATGVESNGVTSETSGEQSSATTTASSTRTGSSSSGEDGEIGESAAGRVLVVAWTLAVVGGTMAWTLL